MNEGINIRGIKEDIRANEKISTSYRGHEDEWHIYNVPLQAFAPTFITALPSEYADIIEKKLFADLPDYGEVFKKYIEDTLSNSPNRADLTAVEFGGPGSELFAGFTPKFFKKTLGVCLNDIRGAESMFQDFRKHHELLVGDIMNPQTEKLVERVQEKLHSSKTDLIISRMMGPLDEIKMNPALLDRIIRSWYGMLNKGGLILVQFESLIEHNPDTKTIAEAKAETLMYGQPRSFLQVQTENWAKSVKEKFPSLDIQVGHGVLRIQKTSGSPDELPSAKDLTSKS